MLTRLSVLILCIIACITAFFSYKLTQVKLDYDFEKFFPLSDPETNYFFEYRKNFESDNDFVLFGIEAPCSVFDSTFLLKVDSFANTLKKINHIEQVISPTSISEPVKTAFGFINKPVLHLNEPGRLQEDSVIIYSEKIYTGAMFSNDAKALCILAKTKPYLSKEACDTLAKKINSLVKTSGFNKIYVAGRSTGQVYYVEMMQKQLKLFVLTSIILVVCLLAITFRSIWGIAIPVLIVVFTAVWIVGFISFSGGEINIILTVLPTIMFVVGMSDVVHVISRYVEELKSGKKKSDALKLTYKEVGLATFLTSLTTAIGFLTLITISIKPVQDFGLYTSLGVLFAYILTFTLLPACLWLLPAPKYIYKSKSNIIPTLDLKRALLFTLKYRKIILACFVLFAIPSLYFAFRLQVNNFLLEDLRDDNELKKEFSWFEKKFSGVRPFEMGINVNTDDTTQLNLDALRETEKIENYLKNKYGVGYFISAVNVTKFLNKALHAGNSEHYKIPDTQHELNEIIAFAKKLKDKNPYKQVLSYNNKLLRISGKTADLGSAYYREKNKELEMYYRNNIDTNLVNYVVTGTAHLVDKNNACLAQGTVYGLAISFMVIAIIAGLIYKSFRIIIITFIPNIIPLLFIAGLMGVLQIDIKVSTAMVFTIAFGIAVDDTIHFMSKLKIELAKGKTLLYAIKRTYLSTGKAIILTSVILSGGFLTLIFSDFNGTFYLGLMVGLALIFALICDLLLLPLLLIYFYRKN